jgi:hypothetical protein
MWSSIEDIIELLAAVLVVIVVLWAVTAKLWRAGRVINRIVESNLLDRLEALPTKEERALEVRDKQLNLKRAG